MLEELFVAEWATPLELVLVVVLRQVQVLLVLVPPVLVEMVPVEHVLARVLLVQVVYLLVFVLHVDLQGVVASDVQLVVLLVPVPGLHD